MVPLIGDFDCLFGVGAQRWNFEYWFAPTGVFLGVCLGLLGLGIAVYVNDCNNGCIFIVRCVVLLCAD